MADRTFSDDERHEIGKRLGSAIHEMVGVIAVLDGVSTDEVLETIFAEYVARRIIEESGS